MSVKIGINGFGRIGRLAFRRIFQLQQQGGGGQIEVVAINDLTTPAMLAYLLKYDSTHGRFRRPDGKEVAVESDDSHVIVEGKPYRVYAEKDASVLPWAKEDGVDYVLECTGFYASFEKSQAHIRAGAKKVLVSAPCKDDITPTVVYGVNHKTLKRDDSVVSAGSCTTNSLAPMVSLLESEFGIQAGFMTTIHAYTSSQMLLDGPRFSSPRSNRSAAFNTVAHSSGAASAIGKVVPAVAGKLTGHAQRVSVCDGSVTELTALLKREASRDEINSLFKDAYSGCEYFGYNGDGIASSDIIGDTHGGVFDPTQTEVLPSPSGQLARTVSFYDNEYGFTCNMVRTLLYFSELD